MYIREIFDIRGPVGSFTGKAPYLTMEDCQIEQVSRNDYGLVLRVKRESDSLEGTFSLKVKEEFKSIERLLLARAFILQIINFTPRQLNDLKINWDVQRVGGRYQIVP